jgi:hypothetical protein
MQRIFRSRPNGGRSHGQARRRRQSTAPGPVRAVAAPGVTTLAPAFGQALPVLDGLPAAYSHEANAELLYDLCVALAQEGLGNPDAWQKCGESAPVFIQKAIMEGIGEGRWNLLQRNAEYHLTVSDVADRDGCNAPLEDGRLAVTIECSGSGFLKLGPMIVALEDEAVGLGAAFYWTLTYALYRVMRVYNHEDALQYEERIHEYAEDDPENREQYEFPEVEKSLPECIRNTLKLEYGAQRREARRLLSRHRRGKHSTWIERLRSIERLSRLALPSDRSFLEEGNYDSIPLPSLLIAFQQQDAIVACFDEEGQYMLEASSEPTVGVLFSPQKPDEVRHALRVVARFVSLNDELFQLAEELEQWEKRYADTPLDWSEPSRRAA